MKFGTAVCLERTARRFLDPERRALFLPGRLSRVKRKTALRTIFLGFQHSAIPALKLRPTAEAREDACRALGAPFVDTFALRCSPHFPAKKAGIADFISNPLLGAPPDAYSNPTALGAWVCEFRFPSSGAEGAAVRSRESAAPCRRRHEKAREHGARGLFGSAGRSALRTRGAGRRRRCWTGSSSGRVRRHNRRRSQCARSRGRPRRLRGAGYPSRFRHPAR